MHPNPIYRQTPPDQATEFARNRAFGTLTVNGDEGPLASHVPFLLSEDGKTADIHLVRSNPIVRALSVPQKCLLAVNGADSYISPDWYGLDDQVPTWNYVAVHLTGTLVRLAQDEIRRLVEELSDHFESRIEGKTPWRTNKMTAGTMEKMLIQIVPFRFEIEDVQGTWKLNQNKPDTARLSAAAQVETSPLGLGTGALAGLMRSVPTD